MGLVAVVHHRRAVVAVLRRRWRWPHGSTGREYTRLMGMASRHGRRAADDLVDPVLAAFSVTASTFAGYPVRFEALWVPGCWRRACSRCMNSGPAWSVLGRDRRAGAAVTKVTLGVPRRQSRRRSLHRLVSVRLPEMGGEMSLFLAAACFQPAWRA